VLLREYEEESVVSWIGPREKFNTRTALRVIRRGIVQSDRISVVRTKNHWSADQLIDRVAGPRPWGIDLADSLTYLINGSEIERRRAGEIHRRLDTPIIFLTGSCEPDILKRIKAVGGAGLLIKPILPDQLKRVVAAALT
jgi:CheY-like chemotaxis protein